MLEPARIKTRIVLQASQSITQKNLAFWNELHRLGLVKHVDTADLAIWGTGNCIIAFRMVDDASTEIHLVIARRQKDYAWVNGLHPDDQARTSWNRLRTLVLEQRWAQWIALFEDQHRLISEEMERLAEREPQYDEKQLMALAKHRTQKPRVSDEENERAAQKEIQRLRQGIDQARSFKEEQIQVADRTTEEMARVFAKMLESEDLSATAKDGEESEADYLETKIREAREKLLQAGVPDTDENIAARLPPSRKGSMYSREWVNKVRNRMRRRGIDV